jgi:hypothetical protein
MSALAPVGTFFSELSSRRAEIDAPAGLPLAEIQALRDVDQVLGPEALGDVRVFAPIAPSSDELRLPAPPIRAPDGQSLYAALGRAVACFVASASEAAPIDPNAAVDEARAMALLRGIHGLEQQIRARIAQSSRV